MITAGIVTKFFLSFLIIKGIIESYLEAKNKSHIFSKRAAVPEKFAGQISLEEHQKAADYSVTKIKVAQVFEVVGFVMLLAWTLGGGLEYLNKTVAAISESSIVRGMAFFALFSLISTFIGLPQNIYNTFVIEERFGFNKMTPKLFVIDLFKGLILGSLIGLPILAGLLWFIESAGDHWWVLGWAFLTTVQLVLLWAYPTFIAPLFNKFSPLEEGEVKERVMGLLERTGFFSKGLFVMNASIRSSHGNAYFTGFGRNKRIVFFDTLINVLQPGEVEAVLAHELGHFKRKHVLKGLLKAICFSGIGFFILGQLMKQPAFFTGHGIETMTTYSALAIFMMVAGVYTFWLTPLSSKISRKYEFEADEFASQHAEAKNLITALVKLYKDNASTLTPDPTYSAWYHSHPPALTRVEHLESLA
ncbi:MAG: M48 family metallopeptidase [Halobacteriovoraceae bacterium]|jgi:STE24 endopeptidase|nr:M48 family metallopeptidase [Halobacteriovoraceae bacterium]MBT5094646.1 M48 family metallopeptidase [Halobacteriovoraceae bacterium]